MAGLSQPTVELRLENGSISGLGSPDETKGDPDEHSQESRSSPVTYRHDLASPFENPWRSMQSWGTGRNTDLFCLGNESLPQGLEGAFEINFIWPQIVSYTCSHPTYADDDIFKEQSSNTTFNIRHQSLGQILLTPRTEWKLFKEIARGS